MPLSRLLCLACLVAACSEGSSGDPLPDAAPIPDAAQALDAAHPDAATVDAAPPACTTPAECAALAEQQAVDRLASLVGDPVALEQFLAAVPKGGDLHNHLSGAVYAETLLGWARNDGNCINSSSFAAVAAGQCSAAGSQPVPVSGSFFDMIVGAWSMEGFVPGAQTGHDHFFATFGKFGVVAGAHRADSLADVAARAADENQLYVETMFNLGTKLGALSASKWSGTLTAADLPGLYDAILADPGYAAALAGDLAAVDTAYDDYRQALDCDGKGTSDACEVTVRFVAQVSRTGANDQIFGQLISSFEMARVNGRLVGANLSSPEDDSASLNNYDLHMAMLDFLHDKYATSSPLRITLHAGELTAAYVGAEHLGTHIRKAVEVGHAVRIGHGLDVLADADAADLLADMAGLGVLVEICLSSNVQILEVSGDAHPLAAYLEAGVPVALATDDQGVSRSSLAGEYRRAVLDQGLDYRQLKTMARASLEHAFLPGESLAASTACDVLADFPDADCQTFLAGSEKARLQWELERRFLAFERHLP